jgi:hypothetical protein
MRNAPSVLIPVGRSRLGRRLLVLAWCAGLTLLVAWQVQRAGWQTWAGLSAAQTVMVVLLGVCGLLAWRSHLRTAKGLLDWDGSVWCWTTARGVCTAKVLVCCDLQRRMLVRLEPSDDSGLQWLWLSPGSGEAHWRAARRALYFQGCLQAPP